MKNTIYKLSILFLVFFTAIANGYSQTYNLTDLNGSVQLLGSDYGNSMNVRWNIDVAKNTNFEFNVEIEVEGYDYDYIIIYEVDEAGVDYPILEVGGCNYDCSNENGVFTGTINTTLGSGKAAIEFVSDMDVSNYPFVEFYGVDIAYTSTDIGATAVSTPQTWLFDYDYKNFYIAKNTGSLNFSKNESFRFFNDSQKGAYEFYLNGTSNLKVNQAGDLSFNTANSTFLFYGTVKANEVIIEALTADFVFEEDYNLRSLDEVESFITENKHLPDVPSAKAMEENGLGVAEMNQLLLQKVEELTLYMIELKKENAELKALYKTLETEK